MKKTLALILTFIMVLALVPSVAFAAGNTIYVDATNGDDTTGDGTGANPYKTVGKAAEKAVSGDTIMLGEGEYTLYNISSDNTTKSKDLTFIGKGADKTVWNIGTGIVDQRGQGNGDFSFKDSGTIEFQNMTLKAAVISETGEQVDWDYTGFAHTTNTIVKNCTVNGKTFYWGYTSAIFKNTTFYCPAGDYAVWTYSSPTMTFDNCTFNSSGKVINVYNEGDTPNVTVNFNNCTVNSTELESLSVMNINDSKVESFTINFNGKNTIKGIKADGIHETGGSHASAASSTDSTVKKTSAQATCSKLFEFNMKYGNGNNGKTTVNIDGKTVWKNGKMESHAIDTTNDKYTDGYKDKAFTVKPNANGPGSFEVTCDYCGYKEISTGGLYNDIELERTVKQNSNPVSEDAANSDKYKVANSNNITVDYTATMNMEKLRWLVAGKDVDLNTIPGNTASSPWELLTARPDWITEDTVVFLKFTFDKNINLGTFQTNYNNATTTEAKEKLLKLESNMFKIADEGGVQFNTAKGTMTITCKWKEDASTNNSTIILKGHGLPVNDNWGGNKIEITNSGCVGGMVHINPMGGAMEAMVEPGSNVAANVQVQNTTPPEISPTIQIPIVGGCKTDEFTLYYGGGSSGDSSGGSSSGGGYYYPTTTPVPVIVIPPKTGDMTVWQSILHFLGIR